MAHLPASATETAAVATAALTSDDGLQVSAIVPVAVGCGRSPCHTVPCRVWRWSRVPPPPSPHAVAAESSASGNLSAAVRRRKHRITSWACRRSSCHQFHRLSSPHHQSPIVAPKSSAARRHPSPGFGLLDRPPLSTFGDGYPRPSFSLLSTSFHREHGEMAVSSALLNHREER